MERDRQPVQMGNAIGLWSYIVQALARQHADELDDLEQRVASEIRDDDGVCATRGVFAPVRPPKPFEPGSDEALIWNTRVTLRSTGLTDGERSGLIEALLLLQVEGEPWYHSNAWFDVPDAVARAVDHLRKQSKRAAALERKHGERLASARTPSSGASDDGG